MENDVLESLNRRVISIGTKTCLFFRIGNSIIVQDIDLENTNLCKVGKIMIEKNGKISFFESVVHNHPYSNDEYASIIQHALGLLGHPYKIIQLKVTPVLETVLKNKLEDIDSSIITEYFLDTFKIYFHTNKEKEIKELLEKCISGCTYDTYYDRYHSSGG